MRSNNPVLSRAETFQASNPQQYFQGGAYTTHAPNVGWQDAAQGYGQPGMPPSGFLQGGQPAGRMTIDDVIIKSVLMLLGLLAAGAVAWILLPLKLMYPVAIGGSLIAAVTVWIVASRRTVSPVAVGVYALIEGLVIGSWSRILEYLYPGIVLQAVIGTIVAAFVVFGAYQFFGARVRGRLARIVIAATIAYGIFALINLLMYFVGVNIGAFAVGPGAGMLAWITGGLGVVLASASLLMDFEYVENGVRNGAPESESWRAAFGLMVTMIWLYTTILRILSYFRN